VSAPSTPAEVIKGLRELTSELTATNAALKAAEYDGAQKRHAADMAESRAFLAADGSMELRKHTARVAADRPEGEAKVAEALVRVLRSRIREIETRIDVGRTYGATIRAEYKTLGAMES
jgi:hypothetical protein